MQTKVKRRTAQEIRDLKLQWRNDPHWDVEKTEGFEAHHEELLEYRLTCELEVKERIRRELEEKAERLGVPGNVALADYVDHL